MDSQVYTEKRDALLQILGNAAGYEELDKDARDLFAQTIQKLQTDSFEIVLVGEFQGGKSTTFNALCDGRDISPMGSGVKTSACKISARNIVDPNEEERAVVQWKTDDELFLTLRDYATRHLEPEEAERLCRQDERGRFTNFDFDNPADFQKLKECVDKEWEVYKRRPAQYDPQQTGKLDLLYIASLILRFRNDENIRKLREEPKTTSVEEMRRYVAFPIDWAERWGQRSPDAFEWREIALAFVSQVDCYIRSPNLRRLGCVVTDCPGLFAGPWDTAVAHEAMLRADAILYLLNGSRQVGVTELKALRMIQEDQQLHKLFFAMNARNAYDHLRDVLRPTNVSTINNHLGDSNFQVKAEDVRIYNALLAYSAKHYPILAQNATEEELKAWRKTARRAIETLLQLDYEDDAERLKALLQNPNELSRESGYDELIDAIESLVIERKAESLLFTNGVVPVNAALARLEGDWRLREKNVWADDQKAEAAENEANAALTEFQETSIEMMNAELDARDVVEVLGNDYVESVYLDNANGVAERIAEKIDELMRSDSGQWKYILGIIKRRIAGHDNRQTQELNDAFKDYVSQAIEETCGPAKKGWLANIEQSENSTYKITIGQRCQNISNKIQALWQKTVSMESRKNYLDGLKPQEISSQKIGAAILKSYNGDNLYKYVETALATQFGVRIASVMTGTVVAAIGLVIAVLIIDTLVTFGVGMLLAFLTGVLGGGVSEAFYDKFGSKITRTLNEKLAPSIHETFRSGEVRDSLNKEARRVVECLVDANKKFFRDEFAKQRKDFDERCAKARADRQKTLAERERVAKEAREIYMQIAEYRAPIAAFQKEVEPYFGAATNE